MKGEVVFDTSDLFVMNLIHYFITEKNYNPVVLKGITDEIWLENMQEDYKIVRIVSHYIHNDEQLKFDKFRLNQIRKNLRKKTFSFKMPVFSIYTNLGEDVDLTEEKDERSVFLKEESDIDNQKVIEVFPDIVNKTKYDEKGMELFFKISEDISKKNYKRSVKIDKLFSKKTPLISYSLIVICSIIFFISVILGNDLLSIPNKILLNMGGNVGILVKYGEYYRLLTCIFLHAGIIHLVLNMYSLYIIGPQVESFYGKWRFILIYLISGICGSLLSISFTSNVISIGASGAIFGLLGSLLYFGYYFRAYLGNVMIKQIVPVIVLNLMIGFTTAGVDNSAHIGGLIGGVLASMALGIPEKSNKSNKINGCIILCIYVAFLIYLGIFR